MGERVEVPWFAEPPNATLRWNEESDQGWLRFVDPKGNAHVVPVTKTEGTNTGTGFGNVWHVDVEGDVATVSPSVHYVGEWHTPNPVQFKIVEELP